MHCNILNAIYQCLEGSGIGLQLSADLANLVFARAVESNSVLRECVRKRHGVQFYGRYMDDIIMVVEKKPAGHHEGVVGLLAAMRKLGGTIYELKVEEVSETSVSFLDVNLIIPDQFSSRPELQWSLHRKVTNQKVALHHASFHSTSIHRAWPLAEISRVIKRCSSYAIFLRERATHIRFFRESFLHPELIKQCAKVTPYTNSSEKKPHNRTTWIVLPYHPVLHLVTRTLKSLSEEWTNILGHFNLGDVSVSWRNSARSVMQLTNAHNKSLCIQAAEYYMDGV